MSDRFQKSFDIAQQEYDNQCDDRCPDCHCLLQYCECDIIWEENDD